MLSFDAVAGDVADDDTFALSERRVTVSEQNIVHK